MATPSKGPAPFRFGPNRPLFPHRSTVFFSPCLQTKFAVQEATVVIPYLSRRPPLDQNTPTYSSRSAPPPFQLVRRVSSRPRRPSSERSTQKEVLNRFSENSIPLRVTLIFASRPNENLPLLQRHLRLAPQQRKDIRRYYFNLSSVSL